jgi:hypothetical protein
VRITVVWNRYEPPSEQQPDEPQPERPQQPASWPRLEDAPPEAPALPQPLPGRYDPAAHRRGPGRVVSGRQAASPAAALFGIVALVAVAGVGFAAVGSSQAREQSEREAWDECIASYRDREPGLLSPADLCEIGHERPEGYTEYDDGSDLDDCEYTYLECEDSYLDDDTFP